MEGEKETQLCIQGGTLGGGSRLGWAGVPSLSSLFGSRLTPLQPILPGVLEVVSYDGACLAGCL